MRTEIEAQAETLLYVVYHASRNIGRAESTIEALRTCLDMLKKDLERIRDDEKAKRFNLIDTSTTSLPGAGPDADERVARFRSELGNVRRNDPGNLGGAESGEDRAPEGDGE
jgi:uncharacterized membrane protein YccC